MKAAFLAGTEPMTEAATSLPVVVYCAGVSWDDVAGTDVQMAKALSETAVVLWVDPPLSVWRAFRTGTLKGRLRRPRVDVASSNVFRTTSLCPPGASRPLVQPITRFLHRRSIRNTLEILQRKPSLLVAATAQPQNDASPGTKYIYYATDDFVAGAELMKVPRRRLERYEQKQLEASDVIAAVSPVLAERWQKQGHEVLVLSNGCDAGLAGKVRNAPPAGDVRLPGPIAGVVGQLTERLDIRLLEAVAESGLSLLLVGPIDPQFEPERVQHLLARANVQWVGRKPFDALPSYYKVMDVGLTPYADSAFNRASVPLKSLEYVAAGLPVVSTPLPAISLLDPEIVRTAAEPEAFVLAVKSTLEAGTTDSFEERRRRFVAENSWAARARSLMEAAGLSD